MRPLLQNSSSHSSLARSPEPLRGRCSGRREANRPYCLIAVNFIGRRTRHDLSSLSSGRYWTAIRRAEIMATPAVHSLEIDPEFLLTWGPAHFCSAIMVQPFLDRATKA